MSSRSHRHTSYTQHGANKARPKVTLAIANCGNTWYVTSGTTQVLLHKWYYTSGTTQVVLHKWYYTNSTAQVTRLCMPLSCIDVSWYILINNSS